MDSNKYETEIDFDDPNDTHAMLIEMVGRDKRVLDFGCSTGFVSRELKERGCTVVGIEIDPQAAEAARAVCDKVIVGDLDELDLDEALGGERYDVALFGDVIEHMKNPQRVLRAARDLLAESGYIVVSVPNVAHASVRLALLKGQFDYEDTGILDDTHLKYFTRSSIVDLLESCGFMVDVVDWVEQRVTEEELHSTLDPLGLGNLEQVISAFSEWEAVAFQYIIKAFPATDVAQVQTLSEGKVQAERRLKVLEREVGWLRLVAENSEKISQQLADALGQLEDTKAEIAKSAEYAKSLERQIAEKNDFIAQLEQAVAESRSRLEECEAQIGGMAAAFKEIEATQASKKRKRF